MLGDNFQTKQKCISKISYIFLLTILFLTGCTTPKDIIDDAIYKLENQSESWQTVLEQTRDKLIKEGQSTIANEVSNTLSRTISDVGIESRCYTDFLRDRVIEDLKQIKASITKEELVRIPVFCNPNPNIIDMNLPPDRRTYIEISGYNLDVANIKVRLADNKQQELDVSFALDNPSPYLFTLNLGKDGIPLDSNSSKIIFYLPNNVTKSVGIVQPIRAFDYRIDVYTVDTNSADAASDGKVWVTIVGSNATSERKQVPGNFDGGETESVVITSQNLGSVNYVIMEYDDGKEDNGWFLGWIRVFNITASKEIWWYNCGFWMGHQAPRIKNCP